MTVKELITELLDMPMDSDIQFTNCVIEHENRPVKKIIHFPDKGVVMLFDADIQVVIKNGGVYYE